MRARSRPSTSTSLAPPLGLLVSSLGAGLAIAMHSTVARADKFDSTLDASVHAVATMIDVDDAELAAGPDSEAPDRLEAAAPRLDGTGSGLGLGMRIDLSLEGIRVGAGTGILHVHGPSVEHEPIPADWHLGHGTMWAVPIEGFAAYAFGSARNVRPYFELRVAATYLMTRLELTTPDAGSLGSLNHGTWLASITPRLGVLVPLSEYFFLDLGVGFGLVGAERFNVAWGLGLPIPLANLF